MEVPMRESDRDRYDRYVRLCAAVRECRAAADIYFQLSRSRRPGYRLTDSIPATEPGTQAIQQGRSPTPLARGKLE